MSHKELYLDLKYVVKHNCENPPTNEKIKDEKINYILIIIHNIIVVFQKSNLHGKKKIIK